MLLLLLLHFPPQQSVSSRSDSVQPRSIPATEPNRHCLFRAVARVCRNKSAYRRSPPGPSQCFSCPRLGSTQPVAQSMPDDFRPSESPESDRTRASPGTNLTGTNEYNIRSFCRHEFARFHMHYTITGSFYCKTPLFLAKTQLFRRKMLTKRELQTQLEKSEGFGKLARTTE